MSKIPVQIRLMTLSTGHGAWDSLIYSIREEIFHHTNLEHHRTLTSKNQSCQGKNAYYKAAN